MIPFIYVTGLILVTACFHCLCRSRIVATVWSFCVGTFFVAIASGVTSASYGAPLTIIDFAFGFVVGAIGSFLPNVFICAVTEMAIIGLVGRIGSSEPTMPPSQSRNTATQSPEESMIGPVGRTESSDPPTRPSQSRSAPTQPRKESMPRLTFVAIAFIHFTVCVAVIASVLRIMQSVQQSESASASAIGVVLLSICGVVAFPVSILMYYLETFMGNNLTAIGLLLLLNSFAVAFVIVKLMRPHRKSRDQK